MVVEWVHELHLLVVPVLVHETGAVSLKYRACAWEWVSFPHNPQPNPAIPFHFTLLAYAMAGSRGGVNSHHCSALAGVVVVEMVQPGSSDLPPTVMMFTCDLCVAHPPCASQESARESKGGVSCLLPVSCPSWSMMFMCASFHLDPIHLHDVIHTSTPSLNPRSF